jgi:hypothetical protein
MSEERMEMFEVRWEIFPKLKIKYDPTESLLVPLKKESFHSMFCTSFDDAKWKISTSKNIKQEKLRGRIVYLFSFNHNMYADMSAGAYISYEHNRWSSLVFIFFNKEKFSQLLQELEIRILHSS